MSILQLSESIIKDILNSLYQYFFASVIFAVLFMYLYMAYQEMGFKKTVCKWVENFRSQRKFRRMLCLVFYASLILMRTVLCRELWVNPVEDVIGTWGIWSSNGTLYTENIENILLFLPFTMLYLNVHNENKIRKFDISSGVVVSFLLSVSIEFVQLFLKLGTWQFSDICYNTFGGFLGGIICWCCHRPRHSKSSEK